MHPRLPRRLPRARHRRRRRTGRRHRARPQPPDHRPPPLRQGRPLPRAGVQPRPRAHPAAAHRPQGRRRLRAVRLGRGDRARRIAVGGDRDRVRCRRHPRLQLPRLDGPARRVRHDAGVDEPPRRDPPGALDLRAPGVRPRRPHPLPVVGSRGPPRRPHRRRVGHGPGDHVDPHVGADPPGPPQRRPAGGRRPLPEPHRGPRRPPRPPPRRHRRGPRPRARSRDRAGGPRRRRVPARTHLGRGRVPRRRRAVDPGAGGGRDRRRRGDDPRPRPRRRRRPAGGVPHRRRHAAGGRGRLGVAGHPVPHCAHRAVALAGGRHQPAGLDRRLRSRRPLPPRPLPARHPRGQHDPARPGADRARSPDPGPVRVEQQPGRDRRRSAAGPARACGATTCSPSSTTSS